MALILDIWTTHTCSSDHTQSGLKVSIQCRVLYSGPQRPPISLSPEFKWDLEHFSLVSTLWKVIKVWCTYNRHPSAPIGWAITHWNHLSVCKNCWDTRHVLGTFGTVGTMKLVGTAGTIGTLNMTWASNLTIVALSAQSTPSAQLTPSASSALWTGVVQVTWQQWYSRHSQRSRHSRHSRHHWHSQHHWQKVKQWTWQNGHDQHIWHH